MRRLNKCGSILIFSLWVLMLLTVFAVHIGLRLRQRVEVVGHLEAKNKIHHLAYAGVKKSIALLRYDKNRAAGKDNAYSKFYKFNNQEMLSNVSLGDGNFSVSAGFYLSQDDHRNIYYGVVDEERKLNINVVDIKTLTRLVLLVCGLDENKAKALAFNIIDWRQPGKLKLEGFESDSFYSNLKHPYPQKDAAYEIIDELMLVEGVNQKIFNQLRPFVTVYGNGQININTAEDVVLLSLGWDQQVVDKFLSVRRGLDAQESTVDDHFFVKTFDIASEVKNFIKLEDWEVKQIDQLNASGLIKSDSEVYEITSWANLPSRKLKFMAQAVYDATTDRLEYYRENF